MDLTGYQSHLLTQQVFQRQSLAKLQSKVFLLRYFLILGFDYGIRLDLLQDFKNSAMKYLRLFVILSRVAQVLLFLSFKDG